MGKIGGIEHRVSSDITLEHVDSRGALVFGWCYLILCMIEEQEHPGYIVCLRGSCPPEAVVGGARACGKRKWRPKRECDVLKRFVLRLDDVLVLCGRSVVDYHVDGKKKFLRTYFMIKVLYNCTVITARREAERILVLVGNLVQAFG